MSPQQSDDPVTHHLPPATADVTEVVVPLLPEDGGPPHQRHRLLVLGTAGVLQVPELDVPAGSHETPGRDT